MFWWNIYKIRLKPRVYWQPASNEKNNRVGTPLVFLKDVVNWEVKLESFKMCYFCMPSFSSCCLCRFLVPKNVYQWPQVPYLTLFTVLNIVSKVRFTYILTSLQEGIKVMWLGVLWKWGILWQNSLTVEFHGTLSLESTRNLHNFAVADNNYV